MQISCNPLKILMLFPYNLTKRALIKPNILFCGELGRPFRFCSSGRGPPCPALSTALYSNGFKLFSVLINQCGGSVDDVSSRCLHNHNNLCFNHNHQVVQQHAVCLCQIPKTNLDFVLFKVTISTLKKLNLLKKETNFSCSIRVKRNTACSFDIRLYLSPLGQARQLIEICGT
jgi:hypothetical protein